MTREIILLATLVIVAIIAVIGNYAGQRLLVEQTQAHQAEMAEQARLHHHEVQDLLDRLQSRTLPEYKSMTAPSRPREPKEPREVVDPL